MMARVSAITTVFTVMMARGSVVTCISSAMMARGSAITCVFTVTMGTRNLSKAFSKSSKRSLDSHFKAF